MGIVDRYREVLSSTIAYSLFLLHSALSVSGLQFPSITCRVIEARDAVPVPCFDFHWAPETQRQVHVRLIPRVRSPVLRLVLTFCIDDHR